MARKTYTIDDLPRRATEVGLFASFVEAYRAARNGALMPDLDQLLLNDRIVPLLPEAAVFEVRPPQEVLYRFCGSGVVERLGIDPTGTDFLRLIPEDFRALMFKEMNAMAEAPCGNYSRYRNSYSSGRSAIAELILLPAGSGVEGRMPLLFSMFVTEPAPNLERARAETQIGTEWLRSEFLDIGAGIPASIQFRDPTHPAEHGYQSVTKPY